MWHIIHDVTKWINLRLCCWPLVHPIAATTLHLIRVRVKLKVKEFAVNVVAFYRSTAHQNIAHRAVPLPRYVYDTLFGPAARIVLPETLEDATTLNVSP